MNEDYTITEARKIITEYFDLISEDHKKEKLGTKCLHANCGKCLFNGSNICKKNIESEDFNEYVAKAEEYVKANTPILDDAEKRYLKAVIRPFRNSFCRVSKRVDIVQHKYYILFISYKPNNYLKLPYFELDSGMYKGMELNRDYRLEELGLWVI